jgi:hypothetical protein
MKWDTPLPVWIHGRPDESGIWISPMSSGALRVLKISVEDGCLRVNGGRLAVKHLDKGYYFGPIPEPPEDDNGT